MAFCSNCGYKASNGEKFCPKCGNAIKIDQVSGREDNPKERNIYKCPNCGDQIGSFKDRCPSCGYELRHIDAADSISVFFANIDNTTSVSEKVNLIRTFPIPNTKEDIIEFMILAVSNYNETSFIKNKDDEDNLSAAWLAKIEQCYHKASFTITGGRDLEKINELYNSIKTKQADADKRQKIYVLLPWGLCFVGVLLAITRIPFVSMTGSLMLIFGIVLACIRRRNSKEQNLIEHPELIGLYENKQAKSGFASWSIGAKIGWVILNIYTLGIPAIIYSRKK